MTVTSYKKAEEILHLYLKEINSVPKEYRNSKLSSKGLFDEITVQDFPIRGHQAYLHITRRRWLNEDTGQVVFRDWNLVADATRVTQEFASFLKEINFIPKEYRQNKLCSKGFFEDITVHEDQV